MPDGAQLALALEVSEKGLEVKVAISVLALLALSC